MSILLKSETNYKDMVSILGHHVPTKTDEESVELPGLQEPVKVIKALTVFGGDQITAVCARRAQHIRNSTEQKMD